MVPMHDESYEVVWISLYLAGNNRVEEIEEPGIYLSYFLIY